MVRIKKIKYGHKKMDVKKRLVKCVARAMLISAPFLFPVGSFAQNSGLVKLNDNELSDVNGGALLSLSYLAPTDAANKMLGQGVGFYKLGLEADMQLNANIKKLQLGCGGVNGANGCDIDIDNLSLSGISDTREGRVASDAVLSNPFIEFAIKNPNSASTREVVGLRLSAEKVIGMLTAGTENNGSPNGINSLSGYMKTMATTGTAQTEARSMTPSQAGNQQINGNIDVLLGLIVLGFGTKDYNLNLSSADANLTVGSTVISGTRMSSAKLNGVANLANLAFSGTMNAQVKAPILSLINLSLNANGYISGLTANLDIDQNLGYIHKIPLNNPFSLSLQSQSVFWPNATVSANPGWWLAVEDPVDIGKLTPSDKIQITDNVLAQVIQPISNYLTKNPVSCQLASCIVTGVNVGQVNLSGQSVNFPLKDIPLATQNFAPNCYGSLKFC